VTGTLSPDAAGDYSTRAIYGSKAYSQRKADDSYSIWWDGIDSWIISAVLGTEGADYWTRTDPNIIGVYTAGGTATREATVAKTV